MAQPVTGKPPAGLGQLIPEHGHQSSGGGEAGGGGGGESKAEENTMGQTVNEESMDAKNDNQEKTTHSSTSSALSNNFNWDKYLKETDSVSAPSEYFRQSKTPPTNEFQVGMKLEARDPRNIGSVCVASVIATTGARLRLRLDGSDNKNDFWRLVDSSDIQPVGTCEQAGDLLQPPLGYRMNVSSWPMFLLRTLTGSELAPAVFFKKEPPPPPLNNFKVGMKIEAVDRKNPFLICPATIGDVKGDQIHITFDGWSGTFDYWCKYDSRDIFPVGWCCLTGDILQPPGNIAEKKPKSRGVTRPWKDGATALESIEAAPEAAEKPKGSIFTNPFEDEDRPVKDEQAAPAGEKTKGRGFAKPGQDEARPGKDNQAAPAGKKPKGRGFTKPWEEETRPGKDVQTASAGKKPKGRGFTKAWEDEARPGKDVQTAPVEKKPKRKRVTKPWKEQATPFEDEAAAPAEKKHKGKIVTKLWKDEIITIEDDEAAPAEKKQKGKTTTKPWKDQGGLFEYGEAAPGKKKQRGKTVTKPWRDQGGPFEYKEAGPAEKIHKGKTVTKPWKDQGGLFEYEEAGPAEKKRKGKTVTKPWKDQGGLFEYEEAGPAEKKRKGKTVTKPWKDQGGLFEYEEAGPAEKKRKGKTVTKPWKDQGGLFEYEEAGSAEKKRKGKTVTKPWKDQGGLFEYEEAGPAEKKRKGKTVTKPWKDQGGVFEYEEAAPAKKKYKGKTVTKPWKVQGGLFEDEEAALAVKKRKGKTVTKPWKDQGRLLEYEEAAPAEKKRKGKTVTNPWKDQAGIFEDEEAALAEKKRKRKRVSKFWKEQAKLLEDEEAIPALFSALSVHSTENTPPSSAEQTKSSTSEKTKPSTSEQTKSPTSKGAQSSKMSPRKTTIVLPATKTSKKSGQTKPTGDTSATKKGITIKIVLPKKIGGKSGKKEKCIPVVSSTSSASLSSLMKSSSSNKSSAGPSKIVMSTVCVYINKHGDCGPYLDPQKVQQLPDHFGPGPVNVILRRTVQACVDCAIDPKAVFLFLKPDTRGGEIITAAFDGKVHTVELPPVNSASFALRFLENFCHSLQCDKFLSSQPFNPKARVDTPTTDLDQNKPAVNEELEGRRSLKRFSQQPLLLAPASSKAPRKTGRPSKASSYIAVPDPSVLKQGFSKDPSTWSVDEVIQFMKHTDPHISGPLADLFRQHEIDGKALLLLKSELMMKYMGLKLGPALKLCYYIEKLKSKI
ncbi:sex comb on midleg-like protein 2 isoform X7 [Peromyscus eremicus]|uniref:sex comb on midleg-like protein 2 isoform X7 n=1 Tax=Peromyscus eremicus TaxID=42410 RepID=UPI0027DB8EAD|nr:sex comb on midleg-like protein 2 isoform X7 [Peromyscus eremicus]